MSQGSQGLPFLGPDTSCFNILLHALAQVEGGDSEIRAEGWLRRMESLSTSPSSSDGTKCQPDETSFNIVLNGWARSRLPGAAQRATDILNHMKRRHVAGLTDVHPGPSTYATVLNAWARSRENHAMKRAEGIFDEYVEACREGKWNMTHYAMVYNSMINCYSKSRVSGADDRALELFEIMKTNGGKPGWELCLVDIYTYTTVIYALSRRESVDASELAISLLEEVEASHRETGNRRFQPTIQLYTAVVNAIGRSRKSPERAQAIVDRVEASYLNGSNQGKACKPDVVFYNALLNAYGYSDMHGRWQKCLHMLQRMIALYESKSIVEAKPDTVSFNSVLNACAYEKADSQDERDAVLEGAVETFELLQRQRPPVGYGRPDENTYAQVLASIANQMSPEDERRSAMAESTFLQCAKAGLVSVQVVTMLHTAVTYPHFCALVGPALNQPKTQEFANRKPKFDPSKFPAEWTARVAPRSSNNRRRKPPPRRGSLPVTKQIAAKESRARR
jgi:Pentatricopeptide repeat domain/PPR repeat